jgi:hypothetical protein
MSTRFIPLSKGGRCVRLTTSPPSRAECHEILEPKSPGTLWATPSLFLYLYLYISILLFNNTTGISYLKISPWRWLKIAETCWQIHYRIRKNVYCYFRAINFNKIEINKCIKNIAHFCTRRKAVCFSFRILTAKLFYIFSHFIPSHGICTLHYTLCCFSTRSLLSKQCVLLVTLTQQ